MTKSDQIWAGAHLGLSARVAFASVPASLDVAGTLYGGVKRADQPESNGRCGGRGLRLRDLRNELVQDEQGQSVFARSGEATADPAPAHESIPAQRGGASGPYPWRRPV